MALPAALAGLAALAPVILPLARRVAWGLGFGVVAYAGIGALWTEIQSQIWSNLGGTSASILTILGMARVDDGLQVILSAGSAKLLYNGLNAAGIINRPRWKFND